MRWIHTWVPGCQSQILSAGAAAPQGWVLRWQDVPAGTGIILLNECEPLFPPGSGCQHPLELKPGVLSVFQNCEGQEEGKEGNRRQSPGKERERGWGHLKMHSHSVNEGAALPSKHIYQRLKGWLSL